jgi:4-amino-4-deoxy-L-arabinose transferase-like glycosyltransferase
MPDIATASLAEERPSFFPTRGLPLFLLLGSLLLGGLALRLHRIDDPPFDFHPTRQYRDAVIARFFYTGEDWSSLEIRILEPPVMECIAAGLYSAIGRESMTVPRIVAIACWTAAAIFLYLLARLAVSPDAGVTAFAIFLYLPFGVFASRSFQPDALMMLLFLASLWAVFRFRQTPTKGRLAAAIALSALAIFVKPVCLFPIWLAYLFTGISEQGFGKIAKSRSTYGYLLLSFLPSAAYYGYGIFIANFLRHQAEASFTPSLLFQRGYWEGWLTLAVEVIGVPLLLAASMGTPLARSRMGKSMLAGLWLGYAVMGLVFNYHICTHNYYQLMLIPIAAISAGATAGAVFEKLAAAHPVWRWSIFGILIAFLAVQAAQTQKSLRCDDNATFNLVAMLADAGNRVDHSRKTIFLSQNYGAPLLYHGDIIGSRWPYEMELPKPNQPAGWCKLRGAALLQDMLSKRSPEFFIVTMPEELDAQPDLKQALEPYPIAYSDNRCIIYDLRKKKEN